MSTIDREITGGIRLGETQLWLREAAEVVEDVYPNASDDAKLAAIIELNKTRNLLDSLRRIELSLDQIATEIRDHS